MKAWVDFTEQTINIGDYVLYSASGGRSALLKIGVVAALGALKEQVTEYVKVGSGPRDYRRVQRTDYYVGAITADRWGDTHPSFLGTGGYELQNNGKPVRLTFSERIVVIPAERVPAHARTLLDAALAKYQESVPAS